MDDGSRIPNRHKLPQTELTKTRHDRQSAQISMEMNDFSAVVSFWRFDFVSMIFLTSLFFRLSLVLVVNIKNNKQQKSEEEQGGLY